jgi:hypothetical protein
MGLSASCTWQVLCDQTCLSDTRHMTILPDKATILGTTIFPFNYLKYLYISIYNNPIYPDGCGHT